jgi:hypothetical protein
MQSAHGGPIPRWLRSWLRLDHPPPYRPTLSMRTAATRWGRLPSVLTVSSSLLGCRSSSSRWRSDRVAVARAGPSDDERRRGWKLKDQRRAGPTKLAATGVDVVPHTAGAHTDAQPDDPASPRRLSTVSAATRWAGRRHVDHGFEAVQPTGDDHRESSALRSTGRIQPRIVAAGRLCSTAIRRLACLRCGRAGRHR